MINNNNVWNSPIRSLAARVELYKGSALADAFTAYYALKSFEIERVGESKFFGYGICQKMNLKLVDKDRLLNISTEHSLKSFLSTGVELISSFPTFDITEVKRDENTNELSVTAYDKLFAATAYRVEELALVAPYSILGVAEAIAAKLGLSGVEVAGVTEEASPFAQVYPEGANFDGAETLREVLNAIAEATQTFYFINHEEKLIFKRLDINGDALLTIPKTDYFTLDSKTEQKLTGICSATELGDNVIATLDGATGVTQYIRDNPFLELREDIGTVVETALAAVGGLTIAQFDCSWRGNPSLELGDKIALLGKDDTFITSYLLNDKLTYNGGLKMATSWAFEENNAETANNPSTLGDALKKTFARVDKANKEIELVAGETAAIKLTTDSITSNVTKLDNDMAEMASQVSTKVTADSVSYAIETALADGVERITTTTGFTFNEEGLHISKSDSEITTSITEDGMTVYKNNDAVLVADNEGVKAEDLHATTYLIVGNNSRFEDFGNDRTGCFWIA
jgi:hypothetical protein